MRWATYGDINRRCTSPLRASPISRLPTFAMACRAKQLNSSLWSRRSFRMLFTTRCNNSCFSCKKSVMARYPICFSEYLFAEIRLTASRWPKSTFHPRIYIYKSWYGLMLASYRSEIELGHSGSTYFADVFLLVVAAEVPVLELLTEGRKQHVSHERIQKGSGRGSIYRIFASSLLMRFSSSSRALAFLRSAINCTRPRMFALLLLERPRKPPAAEEAIARRRWVS